MADSKLNERLGAHVRSLRLQAGLSQADLGARMTPPMEPESVSRLERGKRSISMPRLESFAQALGTDADAILADTLRPSVSVAGSNELQLVVALLRTRPVAEIRGAIRVLEAHLEALDAAVGV